MPTTSLTVDNELLSATSIEAAKEARDVNHVTTPFLAELARYHGEGQPQRGSGHKWIGSFQTGDHSTATRRRTGFEQMNLTFSGVLTPMVLTPAEVSYPIGISAVEEDLNGGDLQTIELASRRAKAVMGEAKRQFEKQMIQGGVAQFEDWNTLNGANSSFTTSGLLEAAAAGSQSNTIGGFNKGTHSALPGANNQFFDIGGSFNTSGLVGLYRTIIAAKARSTDDLSGLTVICSERGMENYKRTLQASERYMVSSGSEGLDGANLNLMIAGVPAHVSTFMPTSSMAGMTQDLSFYLIDMNAIYVQWSKVLRDGYFSMSDFENVGNGYQVRVAEILCRGQLWVESWGSSAVLANGESF
tara:strand:+ start:106 stop:1176 length:1071 start_codon:yes stop_codon:yes gene_type:complete